MVAQLRGDLFGRLVTLSLDFHAGRRVGELVSRLSSDVTLVRTMLTQTVTSLLSAVIGLVGSIIILFTLSPTLLFIVLLLAPALIAVAIVFGRPLQRVSTQVQDTIARSTTTAEEALSGIRVVKSYVREDWELERYDADLRTVVATGSRLALWRAMFGALMGLLGFGALAGLLWYTGHQVIDGELGIGTLTGFLLYGVAIAASLGTIAGLYGQFREGTGADHPRLRDHRQPTDDPRCARRATVAQGRRAGSSSMACRSGTGRTGACCATCRWSIPAGETLALVGPSGLGQDDPDGLIPRLWDVTVGRDPGRRRGRPRRDRGQPARPDRPGRPGGDPVRRHDPREHPVRPARRDRGRGRSPQPGRPTPTTSSAPCRTATTRSSATAAHGCRAGSASAWRSPGPSSRTRRSCSSTRRRARSTTSRSGSSRTRSTGSRSGGTTIIVAHRLSTIRAADRIAVLDDGWLVELGTQDELLATDGLYARLHRMQFAEEVAAEPGVPVAT